MCLWACPGGSQSGVSLAGEEADPRYFNGLETAPSFDKSRSHAMPPLSGDVFARQTNVYRARVVGAQHAGVPIICQAAAAT